jgi:hypothetical protein
VANETDGKTYPRGQIAIQNGDLSDATSFDFSAKTGAKSRHSLREDNTGISFGNLEITISWDFDIPANGPERDYYEDAAEKKIKRVRIKLPGRTYVFRGAYSSVTFKAQSDDACTGSCEFVGKCVKKGR